MQELSLDSVDNVMAKIHGKLFKTDICNNLLNVVYATLPNRNIMHATYDILNVLASIFQKVKRHIISLICGT